MFYTFLAITLVFIGTIFLKVKFKKSFCSVCAAIGLTWLFLLLLYKDDRFDDVVLLALLIGQSVTGVLYFAYRHLPKILRVFILPSLLSLTAIGYWLITSQVQLSVFILLAVLWLTAWVIFIYRNDPGKKTVSKILSNCCEDF
ncbi:hypothetical protein A2884_02155 [Candidatus Saccharibacteria bacterium RIFCSPHIGHO2_01_FULL_48_12]|nr:MAG: hypothetical protein A2884_02155 [Candidatus Saccharibacteria bacterium RIFCSPHIGHO2_01_FULL_48_12]OGL34952.1 MAG: hypothetical protein A3F38_02410 [Candidatus Saccharibacteria bacterium RIFCSPHIGHO2_12_FULL_48_21]